MLQPNPALAEAKIGTDCSGVAQYPGCPVILTRGYRVAQVMAGSHAELPPAFLAKPYDFEPLRDPELGLLGNPGQS